MINEEGLSSLKKKYSVIIQTKRVATPMCSVWDQNYD